MDINEVCVVLEPLFELSRAIGCNAWYQQILAEEIQKTGKSAADLTVSEVLDVAEAASLRFESVKEYI